MRTKSTDIEQSDSAAPSSPGENGTDGGSHSILRTPHSAFKWALMLLPLAYLWFRLINNLRLEWMTNPQYGYGLLVPFLCLGLLIRRWGEKQKVESGGEKQKAESRKQKFAGQGLGGGKQPGEVASQTLHGPRKVESGNTKQIRNSENRKQKFISAFSFQRLLSPWSRGLVVLLFALLAFLYLPTRLIEAATPEWRPIQWLLGIEAIGLTLCAIYLGKGRGWLRQLAFPICFFFVAIPWPSPIENPIIQALTRMSASITIEALGWLGVPAMAHGNVIEVATGMVGIDEACSGIRSFQSSIMISLFFGEFYALSRSRRWLLVPAGFLFSMAFNVCRMALLTLIAAKEGVPAISQYHDPAGVTIAIACTVALWGMALWMRKKPGEVVEDFTGQGKQPSEVGGPVEYGIDSTGQGLHGPRKGESRKQKVESGNEKAETLKTEKQKVEDNSEKAESSPVKWGADFTGQGKQPSEVASQRLHGPGKTENKNEFQLSAFSISAFKNVRGLAISLLIWLVLVEAGVELWYRHLESQLKPGPAWSLNFPQDNATLQDLPIPADTRYLLRFDEGKQAAWTESDGTRWMVFYCSWLPGKVAGYLAKRHTPEICMQATGQKMVSGPELTMMNVHGVELPVRSYVFETAGGPLNVFHCRWEAGVENSAYVEHESARFNLIRGIWAGRGNKGQKVWEIIISGMDDPGQAKAAMVRQLEKMVTVSAVGAPNSDSAR